MEQLHNYSDSSLLWLGGAAAWKNSVQWHGEVIRDSFDIWEGVK